MAKKPVIGHVDCPTCGSPDMEIRRDKNENPYGYCRPCGQQVLTQGGPRGDKLLARARPVVAPTVGNGNDEPEPKKPGFWESMTGVAA